MIKTQLRKLAKKVMYLPPSSAVLMFHHLEEEPLLPRSNCRLKTECFYDVISSFPRESYVSIEKILSKAQRKIVITFDDGLEDVYRIAYPFLREKKIPFCIFVVTDFLDKPGYITTEQLLEMNKDPLVTIGSHGVTHAVLKGLPEDEQIKELADSQKLLEEKLGKPVEYFAYSHGQFDAVTLLNVRIYKDAFSTVSRGLNAFTKRRWQQPRINIDSKVNIDAKKREISRSLRLSK